jgi:hypothetical protein
MRVLDVDGCPGGRVGVVLAERRLVVGGPTVSTIVADVGPVHVVAIDIFIGLPYVLLRAADVEAQRFLRSAGPTDRCTEVLGQLLVPLQLPPRAPGEVAQNPGWVLADDGSVRIFDDGKRRLAANSKNGLGRRAAPGA